MKLNLKILVTIYAILLPLMASAQFYVTGDDPGRLKWNYIDTENYKVIYPQGSDSLAKVYCRNLEKYRIPVSRTTGYLPGGPGKLRMPVVLHTWNSSNGSVAWAPKRMDLFTLPSAYGPEPLPWAEMLAVHESRHVTQMQFGMTKALKPFNWFFGEMFNILVSIMYPGMANMEGDAVIAETALTESGRGRTADFLNYYRVAFDNGVRRKWSQWRFNSQRNYGPNHYALGYLTLGGIRTFHNCPDYMSKAYHDIALRPYRFGRFNGLADSLAGKKNYNQVFQEIADSMNVIWRKEAQERAPFIPMESVTKEPRLYTDYESNFFCGDGLYALKSGHLDTPALVKINEDGKETKIRNFAYQTGRPKAAGNRIFWSETQPDERWTMQTHSNIRFIEGSLEFGKETWGRNRALGKSGRLLYNPTPSADGKLIACVEYRTDGSCHVLVLDSRDGSEKTSVKAPDGVQPVETAWVDGKVYVSGISTGGYGIYSAEDMHCILGPQPVMVRDLASHGNELIFTCDRTGANELYHFDPSNGKLTQKTSLRYGGESFTYSPDGKWLYYSSQTVKGKHLYRTSVADLMDRKADFSERHEYFLAEELARQEKNIAEPSGSVEDPEIQEPRRYRKVPHMFNLHSWAPVYVSVDNIMNMSFDYVYEAASPGVMGIMQNRLSTAVGEFGYSAHKDSSDPSRWRHSGHAKFTYSGLYPVFEISADLNDRSSRQYTPTAHLMEDGTGISIGSRELDSPSLEGSIRTYIPFSFSKGGWQSGIIPQLSYTITNDYFNTSLPIVSEKASDGAAGLGGAVFMGSVQGKNRLMQYMSGSLRAYTMMGVSNSAVYPRFGIGAEAGFASYLSARDYYSPMGYAYLYGYLPGLTKTQGFKLTATVQTKLSDSPFGQRIMNIMPRGYANNPSLGQSLGLLNTTMLKFTADYAIPIYIGDLNIFGNFIFIKRMVLTPHFDFTITDKTKGRYWSAGSDLTFSLESLAWVSWPCSIGVTASYNGGCSFNNIQINGKGGRWHVGPVFSVTF